ncbi:DUF6058 family natural product biosynthesis protein [Vibrio neptunius]|uniref:Uncharacterized protein n=1 Tax=Vibrio neptunius TaxID=170651 RepID=A0ABS3A864_9VIBR|nr:DUF6058 family natural product biosynthesis protein [Vibrio neptunius]MBN3494601.1 hypothetical protein [Vibrio neptunius]MBN3517017.1 hypothetical protein [Vibrio neptunius]MBN3551524.1 hypothetical protein [Vibrio neptunius]MBN3579413.1 hypothetical protein [Vibrio neptunius]MCH9873077.1 hypothetical protein [Vibrio neptunius]
MKSLPLQDYLNTHYLRRSELAERLSVRAEMLTQLIASGMLPSWSYKVEKGSVYTQVFGQHSAHGCVSDEYFSPCVIDWYHRHRRQFPDYENIPNLSDQLRGQFLLTFAETASANVGFRTVFAEAVFAEAMNDSDTMQTMAASTWQHHLQGTFGVCVRQPSSVVKLVEKQVAVAALTRITNNGQKNTYTEQERCDWLQWVSIYDQVAMPFSPVDYPLSSRKRLVDDVLRVLNPSKWQ